MQIQTNPLTSTDEYIGCSDHVIGLLRRMFAGGTVINLGHWNALMDAGKILGEVRKDGVYFRLADGEDRRLPILEEYLTLPDDQLDTERKDLWQRLINKDISPKVYWQHKRYIDQIQHVRELRKTLDAAERRLLDLLANPETPPISLY